MLSQFGFGLGENPVLATTLIVMGVGAVVLTAKMGNKAVSYIGSQFNMDAATKKSVETFIKIALVILALTFAVYQFGADNVVDLTSYFIMHTTVFVVELGLIYLGANSMFNWAKMLGGTA